MIILDTNILWGVTLDNSTADLFRAFAAADIHVAVPSVVLEELASQRTLEYVAAHDSATSAIAQLERHVPWGGVPSLGQLDKERHREHWRDVYRRMVEVIEPSAEALRTALFRESNVLAPCKRLGKGEKTGSRDAAIWLTAVEYARTHKEETIYFVSANTKDFGDGKEYPEPMKADLTGIEDRFVHLTSLDDVVELFARPAELDADFLSGLLAGDEWIALVTDALSDHLPAFDPNDDTGWLNLRLAYTPLGDGASVTEDRPALGWFDPPTLTFGGASDMTAHSIGGQAWYTATVRWFASSLMMLTGHGLTPAANVLETRVLVTQDENGPRMSILHSQPPRALTAEEVRRVPNTWTNWKQELATRFPSNSFASRGSVSTPVFAQPGSPQDPTKAAVLTQIGSPVEAIAALITLAAVGWANRTKTK
ncbi:PIN domain-containing protein [Streptomyces sp. NPDC051014]|uniref:PIN domain-containing protein n=1 Tax=Streptomyces sp. NPDC051014 TaxID=3155751 RepID=UPI0033E576DD